MPRFLVFLGFQLMFALAAGVNVCAQQVVTEVEFTGLTKTKESFLRQYIETSEGEPFDSAALAGDRQRLLNLGILAEVEIHTHSEDGRLIVTYACSEMINTLPVFALGTTDDTFWCRAGFQSLNFSGRGDKLFAYYQYYDRHSLYLNYATDRIGESRWGTTAALIKWATIEPLNGADGLTGYNYTNYTAYASAVWFASFRESVDVGVGYFREEFELRGTLDNGLAGIVQGDKLLSKLIFKSNHLDFNSFYVEGSFNQLNVEFIHSLDEVRNFVTVFNDFRFFKRIGSQFNWANRIRAGVATNDSNPFAPFVLDSYINIRGVGNRVDRGTASLVVNTELRYTIFDKKLVAAQGVGFVDVGSWRKPGGSFHDFTKRENMRAFTGVGFRLIYKRAFDTMLRIDYGYDYNKYAGFVVGIGQYF